MSIDQTSAIRNASASPSTVGWIEGDELGVSARHVRRLHRKLAPLGAAQRDGRLYLFQRNHPEVVRFIRKRESKRKLDDVGGLSETQIAAARRKERVLITSRSEVTRHMRETGCGRTAAVNWFATLRVRELSRPETERRLRLDFPDGVPPQSFRRWDAAYRKDGLRALVDRRGGKQRGGDDERSTSDAWNYFLLRFLRDSRPTAMTCWRETKLVAQQHGWSWASYRTCCKWIDSRIPKGTLVLKREGRRAWEAQCAPRIRRDLSVYDAHDIWCGDEHTLDIFCRVPGRNGEWKRIRPILTAWQDIRSRYFVGCHIDRTGNSDTILAAFKSAVGRFGPPRNVYIDNGADYKAVAGRSKKWGYFDEEHLANVYAELDVGATWAIPHAPWSKPIESNFRWICNEFSKLQRTYCGNKPENKPEGAMKIPIEKLPTLNEVREAFLHRLDEIHDFERCGSGIEGLTPNQALTRFQPEVGRAIPSPALLDYLCARVVKKPVRVTKDGVRHDCLYYGGGESKLHRYLGKDVILKVHPDTRDFVDVLTTDLKPICRAKHDVLTGTTSDDIRLANSRRKQALRDARAGAAAPTVLRRSAIAAVVAEQSQRRKADREERMPDHPPRIVQSVRPDIATEVEELAAEQPSKPHRAPYDGPPIVVDFGEFSTQHADRDDRVDDDCEAIDTSALMEGALSFETDEAESDAGPPIDDAFDILGRSINGRTA